MSLISLYLVPGILHSATVPSTGVQRWLEHYNLSVVNTTELRKKRKGHEWIHSLHGCLLILVFNNYLKQMDNFIYCHMKHELDKMDCIDIKLTD